MITEFVLCRSCQNKVPRQSIGGEYIRNDNSIKHCKVCVWKENHPDLLNSCNYSEYEIDTFLRFFLLDGGVYLNDIAQNLNISIDEAIALFRYLHIANHKCLIKTTCDYCGKEYECSLANYSDRTNHYCSFNCYTLDKPNHIGHGDKSQFYNRISVLCDNCGKEMQIVPSRQNNKNAYGESHHFCSHACYSEFRSKYYIGEKSVNYKREFSDIAKQHMSKSCSASMHLRMRLNTSIQKIIDDYLDDCNINHIPEYSMKYYSIDVFLPDNQLGIEIMGDYWHCNPIIYRTDGRMINKIQSKDIVRDKKKRTYIKKYYNMQLLYLWESDIKNRFDVCIALIKKYIDNQGILKNYNSFNWSLDSQNNLILNNPIIYPYFELDKSSYKNILIA